jgi:acyl-CoA thioesterase-1
MLNFIKNDKNIKFVNRLIPILFLFLFLSCSSQKDVMDNPSMQPTTSNAIKYLALGDSYTIGQSVDPLNRWPKQLVDKLKDLNYDIESLRYIAETGWTTNNLIKSIENIELEDYNLVSLSIGVNNQFQNQSFNLFKAEFDILLNKSIEIANDTNRVFVVSIPDYGVTPFGIENSEKIKEDINKYNNYIFESCKKSNVRYINITEISRQLGANHDALASDDLHPSDSQYKEWTNKILPVVIELLTK